MKRSKLRVMLLFVSLFVIVLGVTACGSGSESKKETANKTDKEAVTDKEAGNSTEAAVSPTVKLEATPITAKTVTKLNLRQGPGTDYPVASSLPAGSEVVVIGRNQDRSWLQVQTDNGKLWVSGDSKLVTVGESVAVVPVVKVAPPVATVAPTPAYDATNVNVNRVLNEIPLVVYHNGFNTCASNGGLNYLLPDVVSGNVIGPHAGDFVYNGDNVLFKYQEDGTFQLIYENSIARFENDAEFLPFDKAMQLFADGSLAWNGMPGDVGRGVPGCDPLTP